MKKPTKNNHMDSNADKFLQKFQHFERSLKSFVKSCDEERFPDSLKKASKLNTCIKNNFSLISDLNALRNVLSHQERGKYIVSINKIVIGELEKLTKAIDKPPSVISVFGKKVEQATLSDEISRVMKVMHDNTYTHIPVWEHKTNYGNVEQFAGKMIGVFSYSSFFEWLAKRKESEENPTFTKRFMADIDIKYLNSPAVNFDFVPEDKSVYEIPPIFDKYTKQSKRLDCLLITKNGKRNEDITGIITSWDLGEMI